MCVNIPKFDSGGTNKGTLPTMGPRTWRLGPGARNGITYAKVVSGDGRIEDNKMQSPQRNKKQQLGWNEIEILIP